MSTLEKLYIQGIRSFGSNAEDQQSITFSSPVTLILGENGCGKTTVIECLKYALTGETPPGSDRGKNFIHDPKIFGLTDILGQIKLQVRNITGERLSVCRSMKLVNRRGKYSFETLDATINYMNANGTDSISKRCIDVDTAMCSFMGVSKAILNNVIFCHQEDSSWPLDEPKKLKEKFDAIFGITEYNKAIEKFIKMRKEEMTELKLKESNLRLLAHVKQEMEDRELSLQKAQQKCDAVKEQCTQCDAEMIPIDERLSEIRKIEYEVGTCQALKVEYETKQKNCRDQIGNLRKKIKKLYEGDIESLDDEIASFRRKMSEKQSELREYEKKVNNLRLEEKQLQKVLMEADKKHCVCQQQRQKQKELTTKFIEKIQMLCRQLKISTTAMDLEHATPEVVSDVLERTGNALTSEQMDISEVTAQHELEDQQRQTDIDTLRVDSTKLEENISAMNKQKQQNQREIQVLEAKIKEIDVSSQRLAKVTTEINRITEYYEASNAKLNKDEMRQKIAEGKAKVEQLQSQFHKVDERLTFLTSISKLMAEIGLKEKDIEKKETEVRRIKSKHGDNLKKLFTQSIEQNYRRKLQERYERLRNEIKDLNDKANELRLKQQSHEIQRRNAKEELVRFDKELEESREKIYEKCHSVSYDEMLAKCKVNISKYQLEHGALRSAESMYKKYLQKIEEDPCCPLCHKNMSGNEISDMTAELSDEIHQLPENIKRMEKLLKTEQTKYESLLQLQPFIEKVARLEVDIPKRKDELKRLEQQLSDCGNESESIQMLLAEPTTYMDLANTMMGDMSLLDEAIKEVARHKEDLNKLKTKLPQGCEDNVSIDDLQMEKSTVLAELQNERTKVEQSQQDFEVATEALNKLREKRNILKDEQIKLQEGVQSLPQLKERHKELSESLESAKVNIQESQAKIQPLKQKLNTTIAEKARLKEAHRKKLIELQSKYQEHKSIDQDIKRLNNELNEYKRLNLDEEIIRLKSSIDDAKDDISKKTQEITKTADHLDAIKTECGNQESVERDLRDNRELKLLQQQEHKLNEENEKLAKQLGDLDFRKVSREKNELVAKRDAATVRKGELLGQIGEINNQINKLQREIDEPKYKNSMKNYRRAYYEVEVTKRIIYDLGQYRVALEWSLIQFHKEKMEKINRLIREYWRLIYRGNDIDYIQIQTDEISTDSSADRRRNYNYRVIQSKNSTEIEMRGRCSAGQRVLSSLIIRMALAETFSSNCGVLALDEPTTNLDRNNILSLCDALNRIVEERQTQSNFMLIIITHDENFISTLGKITNYHRIFRNDECKSVIRKNTVKY